MATRTMEKIAQDYKACKQYVDNHPALTSLKEIAQALGLSVKQVETSLSRHPRTFNGIKKLIAANKEAERKAKQEALEAKKRAEAEAEAKRKAEQEALEAQKRAEVEAEAKRKSEEEAKKRAEKATGTKSNQCINFVIDASIAGINGILDTINMICTTDNKIILTSVTINELEKMQKFRDRDAFDARNILAIAADDSDHFDCVLINETIGTPDDCIIKYCADNKENVVLLTSDKTMELKARAHGIKTRFFKHSKNTPATTRIADSNKSNTLYAAKKYGNSLYIQDFGNEFKSIRVISDGIEYNDGLVELKIGDDVYIAAKKYNYVTFAHYKIVSMSLENNCTCIYSKRLYDLAGINDLPQAGYRSFMRDFKRKISF